MSVRQQCDVFCERCIELEAEKADNHKRAEEIIAAREKRIAELQSRLQRIGEIKPIHVSWNADVPYQKGWADCLKQVQAELEKK